MGRKFALAGIEGSICNWASENTAKVDLDNIQSLKQFITGDPIDIERKGKDSYEYKSNAIFFANCNKLPSITGGTSAIDDRYGILRFDKTYVRNAIAAEGQLEADPRFKDDEKFILEQVAPAMLNKLLERLPLLLAEGIDYKATKDAMQKAQEESRHLWQFAREVGLEVQSGGRVWITDLWDLLVNWYEGMGVLDKEIDGKGKEKLIWYELSNKYDAPVKSMYQLSSIERRGQRYLLGIGFVQGSVTSAKSLLPLLPVDATSNTARDTARDSLLPEVLPKNIDNSFGNTSGSNPAMPETFTQSGGSGLTQSVGNSGNSYSPIIVELLNTIAKLPHFDKQKLVELLTQPQPLPKNVTPEDAEKMRDIALVWWPEYYPEQMQALLTQMYGWQEPGTKYDVATLTEWLQGEDDLIRDRITELIHHRGG
jgi:putative DNA primase/helicase